MLTEPDLSVELPAGRLLVDAKYKGRGTKPIRSISAADLYEAFAFGRPAGLKRVALLYPRSSTLHRVPVGSLEIFDEVQLEDMKVIGTHIECRGLVDQAVPSAPCEKARKPPRSALPSLTG